MKGKWMDAACVLLLGIVMPWVLCVLGGTVTQPNTSQGEIQITVAETTQKAQTISVQTEQGIREMVLTDYLTGVILAEMPGSFALEAKKAQAVVARTYALRVASGDRHGGAVCNDSGCCQSYRDPESVTDANTVAEARSAAEQTEGMVLTYNGTLIDATYFSCSGGMTEDAVAVWGTDVPYLQSVESPGEEYAAHYTDAVIFPLTDFQDLLRIKLPNDSAKWIGEVAYTQGGGVETIVIAGVSYTGTQLRKLLGLRSTAFEIKIEGDCVAITTKGFGHRVGMSQYGADAMAKMGSDFLQILQHYYQGVKLEVNWA